MAVWRGRSRGGAQGAAAPEVTDTSAPATSAMLDVRDLRIHFPTDDGLVKAVDGVSFTLDRGRTLGIVGESGSGKSVTSMGIMGLHHGTSAKISGDDLAGRRGAGRRVARHGCASYAATRWR